MKPIYDSISEAIYDAKIDGYLHIFTLQDADIHCSNGNRQYEPGALEVVEEIVFDTGTDPGGDERLLLIVSKNEKGYMVVGNTISLGASKRELLNALYRR